MSCFIAGTSKATGTALLHAATSSLAQALGVGHVFVAETIETAGTLRIVSLWSGGSHRAGRCYEAAGEPCVEVFGQQLRCHTSGVREKFPRSRLAAEFHAEAYVGHLLQAADGRMLGIVALYAGAELEQPALATRTRRMRARRCRIRMGANLSEERPRRPPRTASCDTPKLP